jgi:hypothetical protein
MLEQLIYTTKMGMNKSGILHGKYMENTEKELIWSTDYSVTNYICILFLEKN